MRYYRKCVYSFKRYCRVIKCSAVVMIFYHKSLSEFSDDNIFIFEKPSEILEFEGNLKVIFKTKGTVRVKHFVVCMKVFFYAI